jgi:hypothetical protein
VAGDEGLDAVEIVFAATFGETDAIFDWGERGVVSAQGILIDRSVADGSYTVNVRAYSDDGWA